MNPNTGDIYITDNIKDKLVEIHERELGRVIQMNRDQRKGWCRNQMCNCGSGKKYKNCCRD